LKLNAQTGQDMLTTLSDKITSLCNLDERGDNEPFFVKFSEWTKNGSVGPGCDVVDPQIVQHLFRLADSLLFFQHETIAHLRILNSTSFYEIKFFAKDLINSLAASSLPDTKDLTFSQFELEEKIKSLPTPSKLRLGETISSNPKSPRAESSPKAPTQKVPKERTKK